MEAQIEAKERGVFRHVGTARGEHGGELFTGDERTAWRGFLAELLCFRQSFDVSAFDGELEHVAHGHGVQIHGARHAAQGEPSLAVAVNHGRGELVEPDAAKVRDPAIERLPFNRLSARLFLRKGRAGEILAREVVELWAVSGCRQLAVVAFGALAFQRGLGLVEIVGIEGDPARGGATVAKVDAQLCVEARTALPQARNFPLAGVEHSPKAGTVIRAIFIVALRCMSFHSVAVAQCVAHHQTSKNDVSRRCLEISEFTSKPAWRNWQTR